MNEYNHINQILLDSLSSLREKENVLLTSILSKYSDDIIRDSKNGLFSISISPHNDTKIIFFKNIAILNITQKFDIQNGVTITFKEL